MVKAVLGFEGDLLSFNQQCILSNNVIYKHRVYLPLCKIGHDTRLVFAGYLPQLKNEGEIDRLIDR